ncbi:hypothetical protein BCON_0270g00200 [Botryotinia convoluta]|uniref:Uncharacterized protein n=1 Tax=Botryotinia convoluta TaxID=54673 RepID=A0A4Z1HRN5_9HELO|nr:hypothetical protein BCON_0270g00200 [Botryotinia convoluta]
MDKIHITKIWYKKKERTVEKEKRRNKEWALHISKLRCFRVTFYTLQKVIMMIITQFGGRRDGVVNVID